MRLLSLLHKCTLCDDDIGQHDEHIEGFFNETPVSFCSCCIEAMSEVVEEYYVYKYNEAEQATVH